MSKCMYARALPIIESINQSIRTEDKNEKYKAKMGAFPSVSSLGSFPMNNQLKMRVVFGSSWTGKNGSNRLDCF